LLQLNLPPYDVKLRTVGQSKQIFDSLRRKYVLLTPEEWVRQHFIRFMISEKKYPASLMSIEKGLKLNTRQKRTDIVVFNQFGNPWMIVECKSPTVEITEDTLFQAARYNMTMNVQFISLTNGMEHFCCKVEKNAIVFLEDLPEYVKGV
jgi:type I site-specific restriction endonuclease